MRSRCGLIVRSWVVGIVCVLGVLARPVRAAEADGEKIYQRALLSTVWVLLVGDGGRVQGFGTGSLVQQQLGLVLTNYHVVRERETVAVFFPILQKEKGKTRVVAERDAYLKGGSRLYIRGKVIARDPKRDLALVQLERVPEGARALVLAAEGPGPGQKLHSIGNPGASDALWVYTSGTCRQVYRKRFMTAGRRGEDGFEVDARIVETQSPVNPGDSGGPVLNDRGELVAVTQGHLADSQARLVSLFIDVSEVRELLKSKNVKGLTPPAPVASAKPSDTVEPTGGNSTPPPAEDPAEKAEKDAARKLKLAKSLIDAGKPESARKYLKDILDTKILNMTDAAKEARRLLEKLDK